MYIQKEVRISLGRKGETWGENVYIMHGMHQVSTKLVTSGALNPFIIMPCLSQGNLFGNPSHPRTH